MVRPRPTNAISTDYVSRTLAAYELMNSLATRHRGKHPSFLTLILTSLFPPHIPRVSPRIPSLGPSTATPRPLAIGAHVHL